MKGKPTKKADKPKNDNKSYQKKLKTFSSSEFSLLEDRHHASALDLSIFKNQSIAKRRNQYSSALSQYNSSKAPAPKPVPKKKKKGTKTKTKPKQKSIEQQYEKVKYKESATNSEIVFSTDQTKRESMLKDSENMKILGYFNPYGKFSLENQMNENLILRGNITRDYKCKTQAAIKIQKVFRGYMTRKILLKYIQEEEERIMVAKTQRESELHSRTGNNSSNCFDLPRKVNENISYRFQDNSSSERTFKDSEVNNYSGCFENNSRYHAVHPRMQMSSLKKQQEKSLSYDDQNSESEREQKSVDESEEQESSEDQNSLVYRHQQPVYSHEDITNFLQSSSEEEEEWGDRYDPEIIFQTNEEYLQSRKSSLQNKNQTLNRLSKGHSQILDEFRENKNSEGSVFTKKSVEECRPVAVEQLSTQITNTAENEDKVHYKEESHQFAIEEKQIVPIKQQSPQKENTLRQASQRSNSSKQDSLQKIQLEKCGTRKSAKLFQSASEQNTNQNIKLNLITIDNDQKQAHQKENSDKFSSYRSNDSSREQMNRLKEEECSRWEQVIRMINSQIKINQQNNGEMVDFMKTIVEYSQKNKQLLGSTRSINLDGDTEVYTTPTSFSQPISYNINCEDHKDLRISENNSGKVFKKKPLRIEIADSAFTAQQKQELFSEFHEVSNKKKLKESEKKQEQIVADPSEAKFLQSCTIFDKRQHRSHKQKHQGLNQTIANPSKMKSFLSSNMHDETIQEILRIREQVLQKKESEELLKLNTQLTNRELTQESFLQKLAQITKKFTAEKIAIDKAKQDIVKGYEAANSLIKDYFFDIKRMGFKIPVSRSQENLKYASKNFIIDKVFIDELSPQVTPKSGRSFVHSKKEIQPEQKKQTKKKGGFFNEEHAAQHKQNSHSKSEDSEIQFSEEELERFRKAANFDLDLNQLHANMTISDDFIRQQQQPNQAVSSPLGFQRDIQPTKQFYLLDDKNADASQSAQNTHPQIEAIVDIQLESIFWEIACQIILKPKICQKLIDKNHLIYPKPIQDEERMKFLSIIQQNFSDASSLHRKLNQKITPLPMEILKCMRLDFSEDMNEEQEDNYEEISKYEFVLSQEICAKSVMLFKEQIDRNSVIIPLPNLLSLAEVKSMCETSQKLEKFITQREKFLKNRKQHTKQLRWEVMNIQVHCLFDSWNEEIIQLCSQRAGFSGIGLNELTLSLIDHNRPVRLENTLEVIEKAKSRVMSILFDDTELNVKILRENLYEMAENDSAWILYSDEALSYALELVYLVQEQIYEEVTKEMLQISSLRQNL